MPAAVSVVLTLTPMCRHCLYENIDKCSFKYNFGYCDNKIKLRLGQDIKLTPEEQHAATLLAAVLQYQQGGLRADGIWAILGIFETAHLNDTQLQANALAKALCAYDRGLKTATLWSRAMDVAVVMGLTVLLLPPVPCPRHAWEPDLWVSRSAAILSSTGDRTTQQLLKAAARDGAVDLTGCDVLAHLDLCLYCKGAQAASIKAKQQLDDITMRDLTERMGQLLYAVVAVAIYECRQWLPGGLEADWGVMPSLQCAQLPVAPAKQRKAQRTGLTDGMARM